MTNIVYADNGNHFRCPKLENIIAVSKYTNIKIQDLLN